MQPLSHAPVQLLRYLISALFVAVSLNSSAALTGLAAGPGIWSINVGVEGLYKNGLWTPVDITCGGLNPDIHYDIAVESVDADGTPITYRTTQTPKMLPAEPNVSPPGVLRIYVKLGRKDAPITVSITSNDDSDSDTRQIRTNGSAIRKKEPSGTSHSFSEPVPFERPIFLIVGNENIGLQEAVAELSLREERRPLLVKVKSFADLPDEWFGYEAIDTIVLTTTEPEQFSGMTSESPQIKAIDQWIKLGGRLIFMPGKDSEPLLDSSRLEIPETSGGQALNREALKGGALEKSNAKSIAPNSSPLSPFLPGRFTGMTDVRQGTPLEVFINSKRAIFMNGTENAPFLRVPSFIQYDGDQTGPRGVTYVKDGDLPLLLRCTHGLGTILYFGGDLSAKPLSTWRDRTQLVRKIMQWDSRSGSGIQRGGALIQLGYNDISGQIRSALDRFDGVRILPFSLILLVLAAYWLVIGPLDWFLVHKVFKRPVLTWITFPAWIVLFCVLCYWFAAQGRPNQVMFNELDIVDYDTESQTLRSSTWGNLYSPRDATYSTGLQDNLEWFLPMPMYSRYVSVPGIFSWHGLPGSGLGGMAPKTVSPTVWQSGSTQTFNDKAPVIRSWTQDVPVQVRSTKSFFGQNWVTTWNSLPVFASSTKMCNAELKGMEGVPVGTLTWPPMLPPLDNCQLVYGRWVQDLGTLEPGKTVEVGRSTARREIRELLLPKEALQDAAVRRVATYNPQSGDLDYIVRVLTFHEALGGVDSVGLSHAFQRSLDMSDHLNLDRTILIGTLRQAETPSRVRASATTLAWFDDKDIKISRTIIFRQSIPIRDVAGRLQLRYDSQLEQKTPDEKRPDTFESGF